MLPSLLCAAAFQAPTLWVSPTGSDSAQGTKQAPFATLERAVLAAKEGKARIIELLPGIHLVKDLPLGPTASGLTIQGSDKAKTILAAGPALTKWTKGSGGIWSHPWPSSRPVRCLTLKGALAPRARLPKSGRLQHESAFDVPWMSTTGGGWQRKPTEAELTRLKVKEGQIPEGFQIQNAEVTVFHMWDESTVGVKSFDPASRTLVFSSELGHPGGAFEVKDYVIWNTKEGLTEGTWMQDRTKGEILFWPKPGQEPGAKLEIRVGEAERALDIKGAENLTIRNLTLTGASTPLKSGGFGTTNFDGALTASSSKGLTLQNLFVHGTGGWGIRTWDCEGLTVDRCQVTDCGAGGVRAEGVRAKIQDSIVQRTGLYYPSAPSLLLQGSHSAALHNLITDSTYSGIIGGGDDQLIEGNRIMRVMTVMHDGAAIYAGFNKRMIYRGNWVSDIVETGGYGASAYYLDEGATDCLVEGNLSEGVLRPSQNHMAKNCTIRGNLFLIPGDGRLEFARCTGYKLENNLIEAKGSLTFRHSEGEVQFGRNLLSSGSGIFLFDAIQPGGYGVVKSGPLPALPGVLKGQLGLILKGPGHYQPGPSGLAKSSGLVVPDVSKAGPRAKSTDALSD